VVDSGVGPGRVTRLAGKVAMVMVTILASLPREAHSLSTGEFLAFTGSQWVGIIIAETCKPFDLDVLQCQITCSMQEAKWLYPLLVATIQQPFPPPQAAFPHHPITHCNSFTSPDHLTHPPASLEHPTTHMAQPTLSMMEQMMLNHPSRTNNFWTPNTLHRLHTLPQIREQQQLPMHTSACMPSIFLILATAPTSATNTPATSHGILGCNPILTTHFTWLATSQSHHQHPTQLPGPKTLWSLTMTCGHLKHLTP